MKETKKKVIKAWAVCAGKTPARYYAMLQVYPTKKNAEVHCEYYNSPPLNHRYKVLPVEIKILQ